LQPYLNVKQAYTQLNGAKKNLFERVIRVKSIEDDSITETRWIYEAKYSKREGFISISFSPSIVPYLQQLKSHFTSYRLSEVKKFKSSHAIRLYELTMQFKSTGWRIVELDWLKTALCVDDKYPRWAEFSRCVLNPSLSEITKHSPYKVTVKIIKKGRSVHKLKFKIEEKKIDHVDVDVDVCS